MGDFTNKGFLSRNRFKQPNGPQPDHKGKLNIDGRNYELSAWIRTSEKDGRKYFSLQVRPARDQQQTAPAQTDVNDAFPWEDENR